MVCCAYCEQPATAIIVSNPERVCLVHALEFWTGLMAFARDGRRDPCVKEEGLCTCRSCQESSAAFPRTIAVEAAGPPPLEHERFRIRLAS